MASNGKGEPVQTFRHMVTNPDRTYSEITGKVYLDDVSGQYAIQLPKHVGLSLSSLDLDIDHGTLNTGIVVPPQTVDVEQGLKVRKPAGVICTDLALCVALYRAVLAAYEELAHDTARRKVLRFHQRSNGGSAVDIAGVGSPALHLRYDVLWEGRGILYTETGAFAGHIHDHHAQVVEWSKEREELLSSMVASLATLVGRVQHFGSDLSRNIDAALTDRSGDLLASSVRLSDTPYAKPRVRSKVNPGS